MRPESSLPAVRSTADFAAAVAVAVAGVVPARVWLNWP